METTDYVSYPIALALKKHGFDYPCYFYYTRKDAPDDHTWSTTSEEAPIDYNRSVYAGCSMPTLAQAQKWLREKWGIHVYPTLESVNEVSYDCHIVHLRKEAFRVNKRYSSYESALSAGIAAALELIEKKGE